MSETVFGGAPANFFVGSSFVIISLDAVEALGSWEAAGVFQRIAWRCETTGKWDATIPEIADEVKLSVHKTKKAVALLKARGWLKTTRKTRIDSTSVYEIVWQNTPSQTPANPTQNPDTPKPKEVKKSYSTNPQVNPHPEGEIQPPGKVKFNLPREGEIQPPYPSYRKSNNIYAEKTEPTPKPPTEKKPKKRKNPTKGEPLVPQKTPTTQDLVAAWIDGYRQTNGEDPDPAVKKRVAGQCHQLAKTRTDLESWRRAHRAAKKAGQKGYTDVTTELARGNTTQTSRYGRQNHDAIHLLNQHTPPPPTQDPILKIIKGNQ